MEQVYIRRPAPAPSTRPVTDERHAAARGVNGSGDQVSRRFFHTIASLVDPPAQRKALVNGRLNVAGEAHAESAPRRDAEKTYAAQKAPGGYWTESEFKAQASVIATERRGDPSLLRAEMLFAIMKEKTLPRLVAPFDNGGIPVALGGPLGDRAALWDRYKASFRQDVEEIMTALGLAAGEDVQAAKAQDTLAALIVLAQSVERAGADDAASIVTEARAAIAKYAKDVLAKGDIRTEAEVTDLRSKAMHGAAKDEGARWVGGKTGLWKVGNDHVAEMANVKGPAKYELMTKVEFDADFLPWQVEQSSVKPK